MKRFVTLHEISSVRKLDDNWNRILIFIWLSLGRPEEHVLVLFKLLFYLLYILIWCFNSLLRIIPTTINSNITNLKSYILFTQTIHNWRIIWVPHILTWLIRRSNQFLCSGGTFNAGSLRYYLLPKFNWISAVN